MIYIIICSVLTVMNVVILILTHIAGKENKELEKSLLNFLTKLELERNLNQAVGKAMGDERSK